jgi:hypothetical protein
MKTPRTLLVAAVLGIVVAWGVLDLTEPPGPGYDPDSLSYLGAGVSLARGEGLRVPSAPWTSADTTTPLVHFPPGFSVAIAAAISLGATPPNAARLVEAAAACATMIGLVVAAVVAGGMFAALIAAVLAAVTPALVGVHGTVLSEPLFLALLVGFVGVLAGERSGRETRRALLLGAIAAAATLVRYAGASLVAALVLDALIAPLDAAAATGATAVRWRARIRRASIAAALPVIALGAWALTRPRVPDAERIRDVGLYFTGAGVTLTEGINTMRRWLAPSVETATAANAVALLILAAIIALLLRAANAARRGKATAAEVRLVRAVETTAVCYVLVVVASRFLADAGIPFDDRLLAPLFLLASLTLAVVLASWCRATMAAGRRALVLLTLGITGSWIAGSAQVSAGLIWEFRNDGADLASSEWRTSPLVDWAAHAPPGKALYSNWPAAIWLHTGRAAFELPDKLDTGTVSAFRAKLASEHGDVLAFSAASPDMAPPDSLARLAGLVEVARWPGGVVWRPGDLAGPAGAPAQAIRRIRR